MLVKRFTENFFFSFTRLIYVHSLSNSVHRVFIRSLQFLIAMYKSNEPRILRVDFLNTLYFFLKIVFKVCVGSVEFRFFSFGLFMMV